MLGVGGELLGAKVEVAAGDAEVVFAFGVAASEPAGADAGLFELAEDFDGEACGRGEADEVGVVDGAEEDTGGVELFEIDAEMKDDGGVDLGVDGAEE